MACSNCGPAPPPPVENVEKNWDDPTAWQSGAVPTATTNGTIGEGVTVTLNVANGLVSTLNIYGTLIVPDTANFEITASNVYVGPKGVFRVGTTETPFTKKFILTLTGDRASEGLGFDKTINNKVLAVNGEISFVGSDPGTHYVRLAAPM